MTDALLYVMLYYCQKVVIMHLQAIFQQPPNSTTQKKKMLLTGDILLHKQQKHSKTKKSLPLSNCLETLMKTRPSARNIRNIRTVQASVPMLSADWLLYVVYAYY